MFYLLSFGNWSGRTVVEVYFENLTYFVNESFSKRIDMLTQYFL